jgi:hypothetical protein
MELLRARLPDPRDRSADAKRSSHPKRSNPNWWGFGLTQNADAIGVLPQRLLVKMIRFSA